MNNKILAKLLLALIPILLLCACGDDEYSKYNQFEGEAKYVIRTCSDGSYLTDNYTVEGNFIVLNKYCAYDIGWSYIRYGNLKIDMSGIIIEERQLVGK